MGTEKRLTVSIDKIVLIVWTIFDVILIQYKFGKQAYNQNWCNEIALIAAVQMILQIVYMRKKINGIYDFRLWFVLLSYLFMFGKQFLVALTGQTVYEGRAIFNRLYDAEVMYKASLFLIVSIQAVFTGFFLKTPKESFVRNQEDEEVNIALYSAGLILAIISFICVIITDGSNIITVQISGAYGDMSGGTGLTDDIALLLVPSLLYILFSGRISRKTSLCLVAFFSIYYVMVMTLTGDRRYPIISIIVLFLAYRQIYEYKFKIRHIAVILLGLIMLNLFTILRNIRQGGMLSLGGFVSNYGLQLFDFSKTMFETLNEFGGSFYTVCLGFMAFPSLFSFRYGSTLLSGLIGVIPLGPLYSNSSWFKYGRVVEMVNNYYGTHPGGSLYEDMYSNFGFISIILMIMFGYYVTSLLFKSKASKRYMMIRYYILFYSMIHLCRASFTEVIRTSVWGLAIPMIVFMILSKRNPSNHIA